MRCPDCGSEVPGGSSTCPACGRAAADTTPAAATRAAPELDLIRQALAGDYEVLEELGRGGMALVYRARELALDREVAVKVLPLALAFDAELVERFQREARTAAQLEHPGIIPIYRVGGSGQVSYFAMKYLRGGSLTDVLRRRGRLAPPEIRRLLAECARALAYAHQRGIVHRDMKPDNVMFDEHGQVVLTDFGIAKAVSGAGITGTGMSIGTPHYMSPEQARAQAIDGRSDIYSLGVMAYQCLTGSVPFDGEDAFAIGMKHLQEPLPSPALETADERRLLELIRRMTMKDPLGRFDGCEALLAALRGEAMAPGVSSVEGAAAATVPLPRVAHVAPTTPLTPVTSAASARTSGRRALAAPTPARRSGLPWLLATAAVATGGWWLLQSRTRAPATGPAPAPAVAAPAPAPETVLVTVPAETVVTQVPLAVDSLPPTPPTAPMETGAPTVETTDSGSLKLVGLPRGSSVLINEAPVSTAVTRLPVGRHLLGISAPMHEFYQDTVLIEPGVLTELQPVLVPQGGRRDVRRRLERRLAAADPRRDSLGGCDRPIANYNLGNRCYDVRPRPREFTRVGVPEGSAPAPTPSLLLVRVDADGRVLEVRSLRPSPDSLFEAAARRTAAEMAWQPALKNGTPVDGWTQWLATPAP